jgi:hypothetical protein
MSIGKKRIVQLCPAPSGWRVVEVTEDNIYEIPVACWALFSTGSVAALVCAPEGGCLELYEAPNCQLLPPGHELSDWMDRHDIEFAREWRRFQWHADEMARKYGVPKSIFENWLDLDATKEDMENFAHWFLKKAYSPRRIVRRLRERLSFEWGILRKRLRVWALQKVDF